MAVVVTALSKRFGAVQALDGLCLEAPDGVVTGFLGRNGAGKSTTLRCLLGLVRADAGSCLVDGVPHGTDVVRARRVGAVLDPTAHHPGRSGRAHLRVLARALGAGERRVAEVLDQVGLDGAADRRVGGYSLGMRQRLHLAGALLADPSTLVLDEPTNGLDPPGIVWLRTFLRGLAAEGRCVLLSSHVLGEVAQTVDRVVVVADGRDVAAGPLDDVLGGTPALAVAGPDLPGLARLVGACGGEVWSADAGRLVVRGVTAERFGTAARDERAVLTLLAPVEPDLEQRFLELTAGSPAERAGDDRGEAAA